MSIKTITGNGRPTDRTEGNIGDIYVDSLTGNRYRCAGSYEIVSDTITYYYIWVRESSGNATPGGGNTPSSGSASIDVTASVGQTIVVEEVDGNGKPTKWKAAEYQPRTHWAEETVILPEITVECAELDTDEDGVGDGLFMGTLPEYIELKDKQEYTVMYNGEKYTCKCTKTDDEEDDEIWGLGNLAAVGAGVGNENAPFFVMMQRHYDGNVWEETGGILAFDGSTAVVLSINEVNHTPIPAQYVTNAFPYYIDITGSGTGDDPYVCNDTVANVEAICVSGRSIVVRRSGYVDANESVHCTQMFLLNGVFVRTGDQNSLSPFGLTLTFIAGGDSYLYFIPQEDGTYTVSDRIGE